MMYLAMKNLICFLSTIYNLHPKLEWNLISEMPIRRWLPIANWTECTNEIIMLDNYKLPNFFVSQPFPCSVALMNRFTISLWLSTNSNCFFLYRPIKLHFEISLKLSELKISALTSWSKIWEMMRYSLHCYCYIYRYRMERIKFRICK